MPDSVSELTEPQKEVLRLFHQRLDAKEIARRLDIAPATVHQRLTVARRKLGVSRSMEAARLLAEAENQTLYDPVLYDGMDVAASPRDRFFSALSELPWPFPTRRRPANDLSFTQKLVAIVGLATFFMLVTAIYFVAFGAFHRAF